MLKCKLPRTMILRPPQSLRAVVSVKKYFLKDPNADLFINVQQKIFPVHRYQLRSIPYFSRIPKTQKMFFINETMNVEIFERILGYFYGENLNIDSLDHLQQCLVISSYFQMPLISEQIQEQLLTKQFKEQIQIFILLQIAFSYDLPQLFRQCMKTLEQQQFEPINYNKFDFIYVEFKLFQIVIRRHHRMKKIQRKIKGINDNTISETIKLYCRVHKLGQQIQQKLIKKYISDIYEGQNNKVSSERRLVDLLQKQSLESQKLSSSEPNPLLVSNRMAEMKIRENDRLDVKGFEISESKKRKRKYSDGIQIFKVETSTDEGTKIHTSGRIRDRPKNFMNEEIKIKQQTDEENGLVESVESPKIRIKAINEPKANQLEESAQNNNKKEDFNLNILKVPFLKYEEQKSGISADPDMMNIDKVSELLDHYKSAYELHESKMFTIKKRFIDKKSAIFDHDQNRRLSAGPPNNPYNNSRQLPFSTRLTNTVDMILKENSKSKLAVLQQ